MAKYQDNDNLKIRFSIGQKGQSNLGRVENVSDWTWASLVERMSKNIQVDNLTIAEYRELSVDRQGQRKNVGYFVGGQFKGGVRKKLFIERRQLITLDIDKGSKEILRRLQVGDILGEFEYFVHSTRSHGGDKVKLHVIIPLAEPIGLDEWHAITRIMAERISPKMTVVDPVSFVPTQVMFWPSTCADVKPIAFRRRGPLLDVAAALEAWGPWRDVSLLPRADKEAVPRDLSTEAADPTTKHGPVGAFCRLWNVEEAIAEFDLPYRRSEDGRWSYTEGTGTNGLVIYDDKKKCHSHHGSDPAFGQNNSFDLTAKHLFGHLDTAGDAEKDPTTKKSYQAMLKMLSEKPEFRRELMESKYGTDDDGLDDAMDDGDDLSEAPEAPQAAPAVRRSDRPFKGDGASDAAAGATETVDWRDGLAVTKDGEIRSTYPNVVLILKNVRRFRGLLAFSEFAQTTVVTRPLKCKPLGIDTTDDFSSDKLNQFHRTAIRHILESPHGQGLPGWGLRVSQTDLDDAITEVAGTRRFHPIRDYLRGLEWDGKPRLAKLLPVACHTPDDPYHREVGRNMMVAAVARCFEPGCKFDFMTILGSPQGWFKSTFVRLLAPDRAWFIASEGFYESDKEMIEKTKGRWIIEVSELEKFTVKDVRAIKNMLSGDEEQVRLAFRRDEGVFRRRFVMWGTTNEEQYLRDATGNRRLWPVTVGAPIDLKWVRENRDQMWAEAFVTYWDWRNETPEGEDVPLHLTGEAARQALIHQEERMVTTPADELAGEIAVWLGAPMQQDGDEFDQTVLREVVCGRQIAEFAFPDNRGTRDPRTEQLVKSAMRKVPGWQASGREYLPAPYGLQRVYRRLKPPENDL